MIPTPTSLFSKLLTDLRFWVGALLVGLVAFGVWTYRQNQALKQELTVVKDRTSQNDAAMQDSLHAKADSVTALKAFVHDLQTETSKKAKETVFWKAKYQNLVDSVHAQGSSVAISGEDSVGKYVSTDFTGSKSIAHYKGFVKIYVTPLSKAYWTLDIGFDPINTAAEFNRGSDGLFFIRTTSLTPGVKVLGYVTLDSTTYPYLYGLGNKGVSKPEYRFYGGGTLDRDNVALGIGFRTDEWLVLINYRAFQSVVVPNRSWYQDVQLGVYHGIF